MSAACETAEVCMFLETKVKMKGKKGDEILAELGGVPTSDKQQGDGH